MSLQPFSKPFSKSITRSTLLMVGVATVITGAIAYYAISHFGSIGKPAEPTPTVSAPPQIVALGQLQPQREVIKISVPADLNNDRVAQLLVQRGDRVQADQTIAVLASRDRLQAALAEAKEQVRVAQSRLAQVRAGAKSGEIAAQAAQITRLQAELTGEITARSAETRRLQAEVENARAEYDRYRSLYQAGATSASAFDQRRLTLESAQAQLAEAQSNQSSTANSLRAQIQQARATLNQIAEVRPVDVQTAQTEVDQAIASVDRAEAELKQAYIQAPMAGQILEIHAQPGEVVGANGIVDFGRTNQMEVVAEVYQSDIDKVRVGQAAIVTGDSFAGELRGTVAEVGLQVSQQEVFNNQPGENLDQRVIKVRIRLNSPDSDRVARLTNLQVQVAIQP